MRFRAARPCRSLLASPVAVLVVLPVSAAGRPPALAPAPPRLPALTADTLEARYAGNRDSIEAAVRIAERAGDHRRAEALRAMAQPGRQFLTFDGRGAGRAVEVIGDLGDADRTAVLVPGFDTGLDTYDARGEKPYSALAGGARALHSELHRKDRDAQVAVVAWLGYDTPDLLSADVLTTVRAECGARELRSFVASLRRAAPGAEVALFCHSYGSVVCGRAAPGLVAVDIAVYGSPGMGAASASSLGTQGRVWADALTATGSAASRTPPSPSSAPRSASALTRSPPASARGPSPPEAGATATTSRRAASPCTASL